MHIGPVIVVQLLTFLIPAWALKQFLMRHCHAGGSPQLASLIFLSWLAIAPYGLSYVLAPLVNWLFMTYPSLQKGAWDVGLALALWAGMALSYLAAIVTGIPSVASFFRTNPDKEQEDVC
ncbi:MAG TPA: hypothetical protein GXX56_06870 [Rhodocyclaceae bacterium]|nr:hypothetical protein [Rhodocyclaceae bacterium]